MSVSPITELSAPRLAERLDEVREAPLASAPPEAGGASFADIFGKLVDTADRADADASAKVSALAAGASDDLHGTMIAVKEADISVKLVATIRNKLLDAFNDLWKTSV